VARRAARDRARRPRAFHQARREQLIAHASALFHLGRKGPDGRPLREHLLAGWRQTGKKPDELDLPPLDPSLQPIWDAFLDLGRSRAPAMSGLAPITYSEILAWQQANRVDLTPWEVDTLRAVDAAAITALTADAAATKES
jgi:hypothetical protein